MYFALLDAISGVNFIYIEEPRIIQQYDIPIQLRNSALNESSE